VEKSHLITDRSAECSPHEAQVGIRCDELVAVDAQPAARMLAGMLLQPCMFLVE